MITIQQLNELQAQGVKRLYLTSESLAALTNGAVGLFTQLPSNYVPEQGEVAYLRGLRIFLDTAK